MFHQMYNITIYNLTGVLIKIPKPGTVMILLQVEGIFVGIRQVNSILYKFKNKHIDR